MTSTQSQDPISLADDSEYQLAKSIGSSRYSIYEGLSKDTKDSYAFKVFPFTNGDVDTCYISSARFSQLVHPNVITIVDTKDSTEITIKNRTVQCSLIVMELTPFGDFTTILGSTHFSKDEKLVRSYFHQL